MNALRAWSAEQQVALLFGLLFGGLVAVTAGVVLRSLKERTEPAAAEREERLQRDVRALWVGTVLFWLAWIAGPVGATLAGAVVSLLALREFISIAHTRRGDHRSLILAFFVILPLQYLLVGLRQADLFSVFVPVYGFFMIPVASALAGDPERFLQRNATIQWGIMVCVYGLSHAPALLLLDFRGHEGRGAFLVFFLVVVVVAAQIAQEAASRRLRRRPLARQIDRSFSLRAWGVGVLGGALAGLALFWITPAAPFTAVALAVLAGACGNLGEFVMRALKKDAGVRYWGNRSSVTGAVGLLDRVAPLCFAAPVFFHSVRFVLG